MASFAGPARRALCMSKPPASSALATRHQTTLLRQMRFSRAYSADASASADAPEYLSEGERKIFDLLRTELQPTQLEVQDISGGCGSMYALDIVSNHFSGLSVIKQHRLVNKVLGEEIKKWHGVQMKTKAP